MTQLSSSELNNMSKEELAAMVLQMQQLHQQFQQQQKEMELQQKQMEQQIHTLNEKIAIIVDGKTFMLACDKCGTVQCGMRFIHLSDAERDVLERIFTSRGGEFPCV